MPPRKRKAEAPETPVASGGRRSTRISSSGKKSQYFESDSDDDLGDKSEYASADDVKAKNGNGTARKRGRPPKNPASRQTSSGKKAKIEDDDDADEFQEEVEDEEDDDDELDEDEEPRVTITPLNKMRGIGGVDYDDEMLHPNTLLFLKDLKANNKRSWLKCKILGKTSIMGILVEREMANEATRSSQRPRISPLTQRLEQLRRNLNAETHCTRPHHSGTPSQGRRLPDLQGHPLQQRPNPLQAALQRRLLAHGAERSLRLLLRALRTRLVLHRRRAVAPGRAPPGEAARVHRRAAAPVEKGSAAGLVSGDIPAWGKEGR